MASNMTTNQADTIQSLIANLNDDDSAVRLNALKELHDRINSGIIEKPKTGDDVNNHIHTTYSFSPYSPAKAVWMAYNAGLKTAGIMDHDSISGAREFIASGEILGMATTIGIECRVDMSATILANRKINNPDQDSVAYMALHGVPHNQIEKVTGFFKPYIEKRNVRNKKMILKANALFISFGISIDFETDVVPLSQYTKGGSITERHISLALSGKLIQKFGKGSALVSFLKNELKLNVTQKMEANLLDKTNQFYEYDLLGFIKSDLISSFYIPATEECPPVAEVLSLSDAIGSISAYAYLGDVGDSVTGDKKTQKFEDDYLDELFEVIKKLGFKAVTYMPSRNTAVQLERLKNLCDAYGFFQISGEDINSPRQSFICQAMKNDAFKNLKDSTWALIGHEISATRSVSEGMFSRETILKYPELADRISVFMKAGIQKSKGAEVL